MKVLVVGGPIVPADIPALCERARSMFSRDHGGIILCDVAELVRPDAAAVDALARLQLEARRAGCELRLVHACDELKELLGLAGLCDALPLWEELGIEPGRQSE